MSKEKQVTIIDKLTNLGLPVTDAEKIVDSFSEVVDTMQVLDKELVEFNKHEKIDEKVCQQAKTIRLKLVKNRTRGDEIHTELKSTLLLRTKAIDGVRNVYKLQISEREAKLKEIETHFERIEQQKKEELHKQRVEELSKYVEDVSIYNLAVMGDEGFDELVKNSKTVFDNKVAEDKRLEEKRVEKEKLDQIEREKIEIENEKLKKEAEERDKLQIEKDEKLKKEREIQQARLDNEAKKNAKLQKQIDDKKKADDEEREQIEADEKIVKEQQAQADKARELAPDKDKLVSFSNALEAVALPTLKTDEAKTKLNEALKLINQAQLLLKTL